MRIPNLPIAFLFLCSFTIPAVAQSASVPSADHDSRDRVPVIAPYRQSGPTIVLGNLAGQPAKVTILAATPNSTCYAIRSYNYVVQSTSPEAIRMTGSSTCSPASKTHMKAAIGVPTR